MFWYGFTTLCKAFYSAILLSHFFYGFLALRKILKFPGVEILWKQTVSAEFHTIHLKLCRNFAFPQIFHSRKVSEVSVSMQFKMKENPRLFIIITWSYFCVLKICWLCFSCLSSSQSTNNMRKWKLLLRMHIISYSVVFCKKGVQEHLLL